MKPTSPHHFTILRALPAAIGWNQIVSGELKHVDGDVVPAAEKGTTDHTKYIKIHRNQTHVLNGVSTKRHLLKNKLVYQVRGLACAMRRMNQYE